MFFLHEVKARFICVSEYFNKNETLPNQTNEPWGRWEPFQLLAGGAIWGRQCRYWFRARPAKTMSIHHWYEFRAIFTWTSNLFAAEGELMSNLRKFIPLYKILRLKFATRYKPKEIPYQRGSKTLPRDAVPVKSLLLGIVVRTQTRHFCAKFLKLTESLN